MDVGPSPSAPQRVEVQLLEGGVRHEFHRTRIESTCVTWNPVHHDLFAYTPQKEHVVVKRKGQSHLCWKTNLDNLARCFFPATISYTIKCLVWSPDGNILCVTTKQGEIFFFNAELGHLLFTWRVIPEDDNTSTVINVKWEPGHFYGKNFEKKASRGGSLGDNLDWIPSSLATKRLEERSRKRIKECYQLLKAHRRSLRNSFLMVLLDDNSILVLAAGLLQVSRLRPPQEFFDSNGLYLVGVDDFKFVKGSVKGANDGYTMVFSCTSQGNPPSCSKGNKFGYALEEMMGKDEKRPPMTVSHLLGVRLDCGSISERKLCEVTESFARLYVFYFTTHEIYQSFQAGWEHEMEKFSNKFNEGDAAAVHFGFELLSSIYAGVQPEVLQFFERTWGAPVANEFVDFFTKKLQRVVGWLPSAFIPYSQALMFETTAIIDLIHSAIPSTSRQSIKEKDNYNSLLIDLANSILDPNETEKQASTEESDQKWANMLSESTQSLALSVKNLQNAVLRNYDDLEKIIGVVTRLIFREANQVLSLGGPTLPDPAGKAPKLQKLPLFCLRAFMSYELLDAADSVLRGFFPPEKFDEYRIDPKGQGKLPDGGSFWKFDSKGRLELTVPPEVPKRELIDLNKVRCFISEMEVGPTVVYGNREIPTVKKSFSEITTSIKYLQSRLFQEKFTNDVLEWAHEIHAGEDFFGWERFILTTEKSNENRESLLICAVQKERGALFSLKTWKDSQGDDLPDIVIPFGEEYSIRLVEMDPPSEMPPIKIFDVEQMCPTEMGIAVIVHLGRDGLNAERRLCLLDITTGRLLVGTSDRLEMPQDRMVVCERACGSCLILCDSGHRFLITDFLSLAKSSSKQRSMEQML